MYFKLFAITEDGKRMVVLPTGADGVMKPSAPGMVLHVGDETVIQLRNPGEGANLAATPQDLRAWHFQGRELSFIATWTDSKEPPVQPLVPDHLLVIKGELAEAK